MTRRVGVVGTGMLGLAVSHRLISKGFDVSVYNRTPARAMSVEASGGHVCGTPAEVANRSEVVITVVRDADAVRSVSFGNYGILHGCDMHSVVMDMSTIDPAESASIHRRFEQNGITWIDTPVMGGPDAAAEGRLVVMAGCDKSRFEQVLDVLAAVSNVQHCLGKAGSAHAIKLCMNLQIAMLAVSISEGVCLARGLGVDPETFLDVLNSTYFGTGMSRKKAYRMIRDSYPATFTLENLSKDMRTISEAAVKAGLNLEATSLIREMYETAQEFELGDLDYTGILEYIRKTDKPG